MDIIIKTVANIMILFIVPSFAFSLFFLASSFQFIERGLCITPPFARLLRQAQISILEILNVFLWFNYRLPCTWTKLGVFQRSLRISSDYSLSDTNR